MNSFLKRYSREEKAGFTLLEILIVVAIIGLLAAIALPSMQYVREKAKAANAAGAMKGFTQKFTLYALENNKYPGEVSAGTLPSGMGDYIPPDEWDNEPGIGGQFDWDKDKYGGLTGVSINGPNVNESLLDRMDKNFDDGETGSGRLQEHNNGVIWIIPNQ